MSSVGTGLKPCTVPLKYLGRHEINFKYTIYKQPYKEICGVVFLWGFGEWCAGMDKGYGHG